MSNCVSGQRTCSMCYGDIGHGQDGYYRDWAERQERDRQDRDRQERQEHSENVTWYLTL
jgi:hypothetical protein